MKALTIIKKEYRDIVKKKTFIISTILTPLLMAAYMFIPVLISKVGRGEKNIGIADYSGFVADQIISRSKKESNDVLFFKKINTENKNHEKIIEECNNKILDKEIDGLLLIPENIKNERRIYFYALNISDFETNKYLSSTVQNLVSKKVLSEKDIDPELVEEATKTIRFETFKVKKEGITKTSSGIDYMMSIFMLSILFFIIMMYGQIIMRGVIEEKNNRIVEILISSTNTKSLFFGKIMGVGLAGLTQVALWIILGVIIVSRFSMGISKSITGFLTFELGIYFVIFFTIGYFMYSVLFAIVGASVNTDQEAQQFATPIFILLFVPFMIGLLVTQNPNTPLVVITSLFPFFTPTLMFMRISVAVPAFLQIFLSIILCILTTLFLAWLGAKIFRTGILMYGKKPSISEIMKWTRYK